MAQIPTSSVRPSPAPAAEPLYWRVEGSLLELSALRQVGFLTWHSQSFAERWRRRVGGVCLTILRPFSYLAGRTFATRLLFTLLRGLTRDRLDLLGEEYFEYALKSSLRQEAVEQLLRAQNEGRQIILVGQSVDHIVRPLAQYLGVDRFIANRMEFRAGVATGRMLSPVVRPRGPFAWVASGDADGTTAESVILAQLGVKSTTQLEAATQWSARTVEVHAPAVVPFESAPRVHHINVRQALSGKHVLLIGVTGFIAKVWMVDLLEQIPGIAKITLLIRRNRTTTAQRRFEKIVEESPVLDGLQKQYGSRLGDFLREKIEVVEGDLSEPGLGLEKSVSERLLRNLDLVVNSAGLTDFNPDLRDALSSNVDSAENLLNFIRASDHAALMHLSTCYVVGMRDGRVTEELQDNYNPAGDKNFNAEHEVASLREMISRIEERASGPELARALKRQALGRGADETRVAAGELDGVLKRNRSRWVRNKLVRVGMRRAQHLGWPNTYTFTKSLGESLLARRGKDLPIAVVRPSIVESSTHSPFSGWNEGINTSGPLSYLLGTNFRQLPTNAKKCLDIIPVDMVCRGMTLIAAALVERKNARMYQLATSGINPCDMGRCIELTGLAHRKHYRTQQGIEHWLKLKFETIPVSKQRYERLSIPMQKAVVSGINRFAEKLSMKKPPLAKAERDLNRAEKLIELYEPFILHNEHVFESENARLLSAALSEEERKIFAFEPESIDWWDYWINIHMPALRRWCYPLMEGRPLESRPPRDVGWNSQRPATAAVASSGENR